MYEHFVVGVAEPEAGAGCELEDRADVLDDARCHHRSIPILARAECRLACDGKHTLSLSLPRGGNRSLPENSMTGYTAIEGVAHRNEFVSGAEGFGIKLGGAELTLGEGVIADHLRSLGLPKRAIMTTWMEKMYARFGPSEKL